MGFPVIHYGLLAIFNSVALWILSLLILQPLVITIAWQMFLLNAPSHVKIWNWVPPGVFLKVEMVWDVFWRHVSWKQGSSDEKFTLQQWQVRISWTAHCLKWTWTLFFFIKYHSGVFFLSCSPHLALRDPVLQFGRNTIIIMTHQLWGKLFNIPYILAGKWRLYLQFGISTELDLEIFLPAVLLSIPVLYNAQLHIEALSFIQSQD